MARSGAKVTGVKAVTDRLSTLDKLNKTELENILVRRMSETVENEAKRLAPFHEGNLRKSIRTEISERNGNLACVVGSPAAYAAHAEYMIKPYLRPAMDTKSKDAIELIKTDVRGLLGRKT